MCNYFIRDIRCVRKHLSLDASTALVSSRLDYCNSLLHSIPKAHLDKLQRVHPINCNSSHTSKFQLNYSFDYIAPRNWNSLPDIVRLAPSVLTFRKKLKTYLFWQAFSSQ